LDTPSYSEPIAGMKPRSTPELVRRNRIDVRATEQEVGVPAALVQFDRKEEGNELNRYLIVIGIQIRCFAARV